MSRPILFARPADIELAADPIKPHWVLAGEPQARSQRLAESADGTSSVMAWSCSAGRFNWHYTVDETVHIISGEVFVTDHNGQIQRLGPGDMAFFPAGSRSTWNVPVAVRKLAVCRHNLPRLFGIVLRVWNKVAHRLSGYSVIFAEAEADREPDADQPAERAQAERVG
ncbi:MAG TPA: cupin domain-containing protein [Xanthobacteraceae bacterium]|nr:cupin domain-containing protein [Xanthobacteraceae bacterium]